MVAAPKHKHLVLDQCTIDAAKRYFVVVSEQEAIDKALSLLIEEQRLITLTVPACQLSVQAVRPPASCADIFC